MGYAMVAASPDMTAEDCGVVALPNSMPLPQRLYQLYTHVLNLINMFHPDAIAVEQPFVGKGEKQYIGPAIAVGQAQGVCEVSRILSHMDFSTGSVSGQNL